jgi:hypothetical protein
MTATESSDGPRGRKGPRLDILPRITADDIDRVLRNVPEELRRRRIWVCADRSPVLRADGRTLSSKAPLSSNGYAGGAASSTDRATWMTFEEACGYALADDRVACLGVMIDGQELVAVDYDHVIVNDALIDAAHAMLKRMPPTYTERSPGRDGVHQIYAGTLPASWRSSSRDAFGPGAHLECYTSGRYMTVTGDVVGNTSGEWGLLREDDPPAPMVELLRRPERESSSTSEVPRTIREVQHMLGQIDATPHESWIAAGMACFKLGTPFEVWDEWSATAPNYSADDAEKRWHSFAVDPPEHRPGWGTLCELAPDATSPPPLPVEWGEVALPSEAHAALPCASDVPLYMDGAAYRDWMGAAEFAIQGFLPRRGLVQLFGKPGAGKSLVALSLAMAIACGEDTWHGMAVHLHGPVAVIVGEDGSGVAARFAAECAIRGIDPKDVPVVFSTAPTQLLDAEQMQRHAQAIVDVLQAEPVLVLLDTLATNYGRGSEDSTEDMSAAMANAAAMQRTFRCLVGFVHHSGQDKDTRARGSSVFIAAADAEFRISQVPGGAGKPAAAEAFGGAPQEPWTRTGDLVKVQPVKCKNWQRLDAISFEICSVELGEDRHGEMETGGVVIPWKNGSDPELVPAPMQAVVEEVLIEIMRGTRATDLEAAACGELTQQQWRALWRDLRQCLNFVEVSGNGRHQCMKVTEHGRKWLEDRVL